ncbi:Sorting nexin-18 [Xenoophorus captivus]|uniref:Sorting nexin-18 n=1 Tax=Xenoophorus captivus TaxID=1517983 RepID=A0ABV0RY02_9TELE
MVTSGPGDSGSSVADSGWRISVMSFCPELARPLGAPTLIPAEPESLFFPYPDWGDLTDIAAGSTLRYSVNYVLRLEPLTSQHPRGTLPWLLSGGNKPLSQSTQRKFKVGSGGGSSFNTSQGSDDDWDDDWDDSSPAQYEPQGLGTTPPLYPVTTSLPGRASGQQQQQAKSSATVGRNLNRFSTFVKSGGEAFLLGQASAFVKDGDRICVVMGKYGPEWQEDPYPFTCTIDDPTKQTKYKHFDWLYARLVERFPVISVPHLPEKQATGRFEEDFISKRRKGLIWWMNHMTSHPVLAHCDVFQHFLTCGADEKAWKMGKRKAERDDLVGANFFLTIRPTLLSALLVFGLSTPVVPLDLQEVESKIEGFKSFTKKMDENIVVVNTSINEFARKQITGFKKEYQKVGQSFKHLAQAFELDQQVYSVGLNKAISYTGEAYEVIGEYFAEQPRQDLEPISDLLDLYRGHLSNFPDIIHVQKGGELCFCLCMQ